MEQQPAAPADNDANYDFIVNPETQKRGSGLFKDPFITKIVIIVGGAVLVIVIAAVAINLFFGGKSNIGALLALTQREQEIVRISALGTGATGQQVKNAAINTQVSVKTNQRAGLAYLKSRGREVKPDELGLKKDATTDTKLQQAKQTSTFDTVYVEIMRAQLTAYAAELQTAYNSESNDKQRQLLASHYDDVQLLLKSWPE